MELSRRTVIAASAAGLTAATIGTAHAAEGTSDSASGYGKPVRELFGRLADGTKVYRWSLENGGTLMKVLSYGGIIQSLEIPDRHGRHTNVSLGYDNLAAYVAGTTFFGATIGRYGNRIAKGRFTLDGRTYQLSVNDGVNSLHGGARGSNTKVRDVEGFASGSDVGLHLYDTSVDGEMGYPGTLRTKVTFTLTRRGDWRIDYEATTDKPTVVNLTHHTYWNLAGEGTGGIYEHELTIAAGRYTPTGSGLIPTGELAKVAGTPFDFREAKPVGRDIRAGHPSRSPPRATTTTGSSTRASPRSPSTSRPCGTRTPDVP
jgi:aldose 1-epimerase